MTTDQVITIAFLVATIGTAVGYAVRQIRRYHRLTPSQPPAQTVRPDWADLVDDIGQPLVMNPEDDGDELPPATADPTYVDPTFEDIAATMPDLDNTLRAIWTDNANKEA